MEPQEGNQHQRAARGQVFTEEQSLHFSLTKAERQSLRDVIASAQVTCPQPGAEHPGCCLPGFSPWRRWGSLCVETQAASVSLPRKEHFLPTSPWYLPGHLCNQRDQMLTPLGKFLTWLLIWTSVQFRSVQLLSCVQLSVTPWTAACQLSLSVTAPGVYSDSCPLSQWCHPTISSSVIPFSSHLQSFPASGAFPVSHFFVSRGQCLGVSASTSVLPMNTQDWSPLGWTGWISLQSKGLSRVSSNTTVQKHPFFGTQLSL